MFTGRFETVQKAAFQSPKLTITTSQVVNHPPGVSRAKVTISDGGQGGGTSAGGSGQGGIGADAAIYFVDVDPAIPWTVAIGAGGAGQGAGTSLAPTVGGATTVTPRGLTAYSTAGAVAAGQIYLKGGTATCSQTSGGISFFNGGASLLATPSAQQAAGNGFGGGAGGGGTGSATLAGANGIVIIEYIAPGA